MTNNIKLRIVISGPLSIGISSLLCQETLPILSFDWAMCMQLFCTDRTFIIHSHVVIVIQEMFHYSLTGNCS